MSAVDAANDAVKAAEAALEAARATAAAEASEHPAVPEVVDATVSAPDAVATVAPAVPTEHAGDPLATLTAEQASLVAAAPAVTHAVAEFAVTDGSHSDKLLHVGGAALGPVSIKGA